MSKDWQTVKLSDIGNIITGNTPSSKISECYGNDIPFITPTDFKNYNKNIYNSERYLSKKGKELLLSRILPVNSVIVTCIGSQMGKSSICRVPCITNQQINSIIPNDKINSDYLYYVMITLSSYMSNIARGGTTMPILNKTSFERIEIPLPPLAEQERIAEILSSFDDKIEINNKICADLESMAQVLFREHFINNPARDTWETVSLSDVAEFINGYSYSGKELLESNVGMITIKNFDRKGGFKLNGIKDIIPSKKVKDTMWVEEDDVLVAHTDLTQKAEIIGNPIIILNKGKFSSLIPSMDTVKVKLTTNKISNYVLFLLLSDVSFKNHALGYISGTTVLHLSKKALNEFKFKIPPDAILNNLNNIVTPMYEKIKILQKENINLKKTRDFVLPSLMKGQI